MNIFDLDTPLYHFTNADGSNRSDAFTVRQACEGVQIFGGIGSGKTSGSGAPLARAYLRAGFGGLVFCTKKTSWPPGSITPRKPDAAIAFWCSTPAATTAFLSCNTRSTGRAKGTVHREPGPAVHDRL